MKRIISLLLTALMLLSVFATAVSADDTEWSLPFTDVKEGAWYYEGIEFCYLMGVVNGMTETTFEPNGTLTRAQFVQILAMVEGVELDAYKNSTSGFDDVKASHWYNAPVCWAVEQGFVAGLSETRFGPNEKITREQLARLLYLYADYCGCDVSRLADLSGYTDKPSDWAYEQVQWAVAAGIISGMNETTLAPRASATRAQACRMIMSFYDFLMYGYRDTGGAYRVIADYIKENSADESDPNYYYVLEEYDGYFIMMEYYQNSDEFSIAYLTDPYEYKEQGNVYTLYRQCGAVYAYTLASEYEFNYYLETPDGNYMNSYGYLTLDEYFEDTAVTEGYSLEELAEGVDRSVAFVRERIALILAEAGMILEDFFLPYEGDDEYIQQIYELFDAYITEFGVEFPDGSALALIEDNGDVAYFTEYIPETGEMCFLYLCEPIPGGTDIFDTSYREKIVFCPDLYSGTVYVIYSYESEDSSKKISISGFGDEDGNYENFTFEGMSEEEAMAKFDAAMENVVAYYITVLIEAAAYAMDSAVIDYVIENGVTDPETGISDLVKDEGDKGYVAEYDPASGLYFVYVSEPVPGGTDIYDTVYREKAILAIDSLLEEQYFSYVYENEDSSIKLNAEGFYDGYDVRFDSIDATGLSEEEVLARITNALEEVSGYYYELLTSAMPEL
ncbi:MAG: S-layer homology domain-containing protein [Clostridia bacterium]|nr:S-layer homology domain-containing protein [Clostridia bacterium]